MRTKCSSDENVENLFASIQSESNVTFHYHNHRIAFDDFAFSFLSRFSIQFLEQICSP